jgi:hypothetical protein
MADGKTQSGNPAPSSYQQLLDDLPCTGPGTKGGEMLRRYWHPVCLSESLKDIPIAVRMLSEDLVVFRDGKGRRVVGLALPASSGVIGIRSSARRRFDVLLSRLALRYPRRCIDTPIEPRDSDLKTRFAIFGILSKSGVASSGRTWGRRKKMRRR